MAEVLNSNNNLERGYLKKGSNDEILYFEERLSKRREKEKEEKKLNDFLHKSLRTSKRLKELEEAKRMNYKINVGYLEEGWEDDCAVDVSGMTEALCNRANLKGAFSSYELQWLKEYVRQEIFKTSYDTCVAISNIRNKYDSTHLKESSEARASLDSVTEHLNNFHTRTKESQYKFQMYELLQLLSSPELQTLCDTNDRCVKIMDKNIKLRREGNKIETEFSGTSVDEMKNSKNRDMGVRPTERSTPIMKSPQGTIKIIKSPLKGCYAQLHPSDKGIPLKTVVLEKGSQPLGATVRNERDAVVVGRIVVGGVAHKSGLLREGDELLSVNGIELTGKDVNEVSDILGRMTGTLKFTVASVDECTTLIPSQSLQNNMIHLKSLFSYNPEDDVYIPCKDIGLGFERGDIIHVTDVQDPNWWQAYKDVEGAGGGSMGELAGLIPSPDYQYQREMLRKQLGGDSDYMDMYSSVRGDSSMFCLKKSKKNQPSTISGGWVYNVDVNGRTPHSDSAAAGRKRKYTKKSNRTSYCPGAMELNQADPNINTYEVVQMFLPQPHRKRPVVIVGPEQIGRQELVKMIVTSDPEQFCLVKQHTTLDTKSAKFRQVTKEEFKFLQNNEEFLETGIFEKHWYGTSKSELKIIIESGKTAVLMLQSESLHTIRKTSFVPYVIFISPPVKIEGLRNLRLKLDQERPPDEELFAIINRAKMIDFKYGHMFDTMLVMDSLEKALETALNTINRLDRDPQWVPSNWLSQRPISHMQ